MTSKLTRERLEKIKSWRETYGAGSNVMLPAEEAEELASIALAAMDSEPVAVIDKEGNPMTRDECNDDRVFAICCKVGTPLYTHPEPSIPSAVTWCPKCNDTGLADSGGVQPWGEPILIECDCRTEPATVAVPDEVFNAAYEQHLNGVLCGDNNKQAALSFLNACRAAMTNGGKS